MAQLIPFAGPVNATCGATSDGLVLGNVAQAPFVASISTAASSQGTRVVRGNADISGAVTYSDIATAASSQTANDVTIFDATNPTADQLWVEVGSSDSIPLTPEEQQVRILMPSPMSLA